MQQETMGIELREKVGKGISRKLRAAGRVPGVVYGKGIAPLAISVDAKELAGVMAGEGGRNKLIKLRGGGTLDGSTVIVADLQRAPLKGNILSVDLHRINLDEKVRVHVPVVIVGNAVGVREGGILDVVSHTLDIECLPTQIPEQIEVDVTNLAIGHTIHVNELTLPAGVKVLDDPKAPVVSIHGKAKEPVSEEQE